MPETDTPTSDIPVTARERYTPRPYPGAPIMFVLKDGPSKGQSRPGVVVRCWDPPLVNAQIFVDGRNDAEVGCPGTQWETSITYDPAGAPGTWHILGDLEDERGFGR